MGRKNVQAEITFYTKKTICTICIPIFNTVSQRLCVIRFFTSDFSYIFIPQALKSMAMRRIFCGFCRNWFLIDPLHYLSSRSDFGFAFAEIFVIEKRLPDWASRWLSDSASRRVVDSPTRRAGESLWSRYSNFFKFIIELQHFKRLNQAFKGTVAWDRFRQYCQKFTDVGLNEGRGWFLNFLEAPMIFSWNKTSSLR